jgi:hypothetical protein
MVVVEHSAKIGEGITDRLDITILYSTISRLRGEESRCGRRRRNDVPVARSDEETGIQAMIRRGSRGEGGHQQTPILGCVRKCVTNQLRTMDTVKPERPG